MQVTELGKPVAILQGVGRLNIKETSKLGLVTAEPKAPCVSLCELDGSPL